MKRLVGLLMLVVAGAVDGASLAEYQGRCVSDSGQPASFCLVSVHGFESGEPAQLDAGPGQPGRQLDNPLMADRDGRFEFHAAPGVYRIEYRGSSPEVERFRTEFVWLGTADSFPAPAVPTDRVYDIREFGATPNDDSDDDLAAIQAAVDAAGAAGGGMVLIPAGVFDVAPAGRCAPCIAVKDNVGLAGEGAASVVRVRANNGPFDAVFGEAGQSRRNVLFSNFTIDGNIAQNLGTVGNAAGSNSLLIRIYAGQRIWIENMRFYYSGIHAVTVNGSDVSDVWMIGNYAEYRRDRSVAPYDNTAFYTNGFGVTVAYNTVVGEIVSGMPRINGGAIGAIELHGGPALAVHNHVKDTRVCLGVVSASGGVPDERAANDIAVIANRCEGVNEGIVLVSIDGRRLRNVAVALNEIEVAQTRWNQHGSSGIELLWLVAGISGEFVDVTIARNAIRFEDEGAGSERATAVLSNAAIGVAPAGSVRNIRVTGNTVIGAPLMGMRVGNLLHPASVYNTVAIAGNVFADYGQNRLANPYFRLGIRAEGALRDLTIVNNRFEPGLDGGSELLAVFMVAEGAPNGTFYHRCQVSGNQGAEPSRVDPKCARAPASVAAPPLTRARTTHGM